MRYIADLHIHSKYSRACSKDLDLEHNDNWARKKGIGILGTGDFTHPEWFKELKTKLVEEKPGLYKLAGSDGQVLFMLSTELSCIYSQGGKVRRIHLCIFCPNLETVTKLIVALEKRKVNVRSDGRPIMGLSAEELTKIVLDCHPESMIIPAHAWTPWFAVFGSKSGFDSLGECFGSVTNEIFAIETGLSSDPPMNWRLSALDGITLISNSDAHSPANLGREANVFEVDNTQLSYGELRRILKTKDREHFLYTLEFFPEEGKYHLDGHRDCNVRLEPAETKKRQGLCPVCKKPLTVGVLHRVDDLADRLVTQAPPSIPYRSVVPLQEIIANAYSQGKGGKRVQAEYERLVSVGGNEFRILLDADEEELGRIADREITQGVMNVRAGNVEVAGGYDGVYGTVNVFGKNGSSVGQQRQLL